MKDSYAIIAGANKAGTTSLFRYMAAHPEVCPSDIKETDFFMRCDKVSHSHIRQEYDALFSEGAGSECVKLEASPGYLTEGSDIAQRIHQVIPEAKLIFCLRDPVNRILSYYQRSRQSQFHKGLAALDIEAFVELLEQVVADPESVPQEGAPRNALLQFSRGCYATHLHSYGEIFRKDQIHIVMFDDLAKQTRETVQMVARFIGVRPDFYNAYQFRIENKTQAYRLPFLQSRGAYLSKKFESTLNQFPSMRQLLRRILLTSVNRSKVSVDKGLCNRISALYSVELNELSRFLCTEYPHLALPSWLPVPGGTNEKVTSKPTASLFANDTK